MWIRTSKNVTLTQLEQLRSAFLRKRKKPNLRIIWCNADKTIGMCSFDTLIDAVMTPDTIFQIWKFI